MNRCPSEFVLDDRRIHGRAAPATESHIGDCPACGARIAERGADARRFEALAAPTWTRIVAEAGARRRRRRMALPVALAGIAAAAAAVVVVVRPAADTRVTPKGSALVEIVCRRAGETFAIGPGDEVAPGDALRFRPLPAWSGARYIQIGSVDGTGAYAPFYPSSDDGVSVPLPPRGEPLAGSIRLDAAPGPERLFVVLSAEPIATRDVARTAVAHAAQQQVGRQDRIERIDRIDRIEAVTVTTDWIVLPKHPGLPAAR